jgi:hypothetical protein
MLVDSPVFTRVRLQLLSPQRYPDLMRAMYSLLMLCPQSHSFQTLHARLSSVPTLALLKLNDSSDLYSGSSSILGVQDNANLAGGLLDASSRSKEAVTECKLPWGDMLQVRKSFPGQDD